MGSAILKKNSLIEELFEITGYKTGLCFTYNKMKQFINDTYLAKIYEDNKKYPVRIRPEEYEEMYYHILRGAGHIPKNAISPTPFQGPILLHKYRNDHIKLEIATEVYSLFVKCFQEEVENAKKGGKITFNKFIKESSYKFGEIGLSMGRDILNGFINYEEANPWNSVRRVEWKNTLELKELFESESLDTYYGSFIDQRFIDYLSNNLDDMGEINWRKFEALTCEYFKKQGYHVEIGRGRNDGGIDARVWKFKEDKENPPMIIIQCKRQKSKIEKVVVKALWADMVYEKAESGLLVTSSQVSKGAITDCIARGYNIRFAERDTLDNWIKTMRTPYKGFTI